jgi:predicted DNA-binding WGR domain protein
LDGVLAHHEAWIDGDEIVEHWGTVGCTGEHLRHQPTAGRAATPEALSRLPADARAHGFQEIDDTVLLEIVYDLDSHHGTSIDLRQRHAIENHLDEILGWTGLGHVDGGSIGSGTMEVACLVVDEPIARRVITQALLTAGFPPISRFAGSGD